jgi:hypothetical protein
MSINGEGNNQRKGTNPAASDQAVVNEPPFILAEAMNAMNDAQAANQVGQESEHFARYCNAHDLSKVTIEDVQSIRTHRNDKCPDIHPYVFRAVASNEVELGPIQELQKGKTFAAPAAPAPQSLAADATQAQSQAQSQFSTSQPPQPPQTPAARAASAQQTPQLTQQEIDLFIEEMAKAGIDMPSNPVSLNDQVKKMNKIVKAFSLAHDNMTLEQMLALESRSQDTGATYKIENSIQPEALAALLDPTQSQPAQAPAARQTLASQSQAQSQGQQYSPNAASQASPKLPAFDIQEAKDTLKNPNSDAFIQYCETHDLSKVKAVDVKELRKAASDECKSLFEARPKEPYKDAAVLENMKGWQQNPRNLQGQEQAIHGAEEQEHTISPTLLNAIGDEKIKSLLQKLQGLNNADTAEKLLKSEDIFKNIAKYINELPLAPSRAVYATDKEYEKAKGDFLKKNKGKAYREPAPSSVYKDGEEGTPARRVFDIDFNETAKESLKGTMYIPREDGKQDIITFDDKGKPTSFLMAEPHSGTALSEKTLKSLKELGLNEGVGLKSDSKSLAASAGLGAAKQAEGQSLDPTGKDAGGPGWGADAGAGVAKGKGGKAGGAEPDGAELDGAKPMDAETTTEIKEMAARLSESRGDLAGFVEGAKIEEGDTRGVAAPIHAEDTSLVGGGASERPSAVVERDGAEAAFDKAVDKEGDPFSHGETALDAERRVARERTKENELLDADRDGGLAVAAGTNPAMGQADELKAKDSRVLKEYAELGATMDANPPDVIEEVTAEVAKIVEEQDAEAQMAGPTATTTPADVAAAVKHQVDRAGGREVHEADPSRDAGPTATDTTPEKDIGRRRNYQLGPDGEMMPRNVPQDPGYINPFIEPGGTYVPGAAAPIKPEVLTAGNDTRTSLENPPTPLAPAKSPAQALSQTQGAGKPTPAAELAAQNGGRVSPTDGMKLPPAKVEKKEDRQKSGSIERGGGGSLKFPD